MSKAERQMAAVLASIETRWLEREADAFTRQAYLDAHADTLDLEWVAATTPGVTFTEISPRDE